MLKRIFIAAVLGVSCAGVGRAADRLEEGFQTPPDSARPWVYWFVMDGNLTPRGHHGRLRGACKRAGIGGVIIMEVDVGIPRGPVKFMSPEWRQLFKHAVAEAERLGLQITLNAGPGWTGSGGPWVKPEQSMQHLVASAVEVAGPTNVRRGAAAAAAAAGRSSATARCRRSWRRRRTSSIATWWCWPFPTPAGNAAHRRHRREGAVCAGAVFVAAGREAVPAGAGELSGAAGRTR